MNYVRLAGAGIALAGLAWLGWIIAGWRHDALVELPRARASLEQLQVAVSGKDDTIAALEASVVAWKALATPADHMDAAVAAVTDAADKLNARARALQSAEVRDRENPDCAALLAMDIARVCPAVAAGVRQRARGGLPGPAGGGAGAGGETTSGAPGR